MSSFDWDIRESGPRDAGTTVLLFPGGMCTALVFEDITAELADAPVRVVAATLPGYGRTAYPADLSMENYAALAGALAAELGADVVGGHSLGANVALEMAASGAYKAPLLLLSPSFSREDEYAALGVLNRIGRVPGVGALVWRLALKAMPRDAAKSAPAARRETLRRDLENNDPRFCRRSVRAYYEYLDAHGSLATRLCESGVDAIVAFGDNDEIGLTDAERATLEGAAGVELVYVPDATHMLIVEQPAAIAELVRRAAAMPAAKPGG